MTVNAGEEFKLRAAPDQELLRKLSYLSAQDSESVLTGGIQSPRGFGGEAKGNKRDGLADNLQFLTFEEQQRQDRLRRLNERLDDLDRQSLQALREAEQRLEEVKENANRTKDGRLAFEAEDGTIRDQYGEEISPEEIDMSTWDSDAPDLERYTEAVEKHAEAEEFRDKVLQQKARLADAELSDEELDDLEGEIAALEASGPDAPQGVRALEDTQARSTSAAKDYVDTSRVNTGVTLDEPFSKAAAGREPEPDQPDVVSQPDTSFAPGHGL